MTPIDVAEWKAARPAARRVRPLTSAVTTVVLVALFGLGVQLGNLLPIFLCPLVGWAAWRGARFVLARRAVHRLGAPAGLRSVSLAELVARGTTVVGGGRWSAVEDQDGVVLTTGPGPGPSPQLPLSVITNLGNSGGGL
jgi:hypothetical protein